MQLLPIGYMTNDTSSTTLNISDASPNGPSSPTNNYSLINVMPFEEPDCKQHEKYVNLLYVYPQSLKYGEQRTFTKARNIACTIRLFDDDSVNAQPLNVRL